MLVDIINELAQVKSNSQGVCLSHASMLGILY